MTNMDKEKKKQYNRTYYEAHKNDILAARRLSDKKRVYANTDAHRKASRDYYHRRKSQESPEERAKRNEERRRKYYEKKAAKGDDE